MNGQITTKQDRDNQRVVRQALRGLVDALDTVTEDQIIWPAADHWLPVAAALQTMSWPRTRRHA